MPGDPLAPRHWRRVIYVTEDTEQARRVLAGVLSSLPGDVRDVLAERFRLVEAARMPASAIVRVSEVYAALKREAEGAELLPLVVFDTRSAVVDLADENDNAEASAAVAELKQKFAGLPLWVVCHVTKANLSKPDVQGLTARGAGAWEDDANQTLYLVQEGDARHLMRGKTRFEATWSELSVTSQTQVVQAANEFGQVEQLRLRWSELAPPQQSRHDMREQMAEQAHRDAEIALRTSILDAVEAAARSGIPLSRNGLSKVVGGRKTEVLGCITLLEDERWLYAVPVPSVQRTTPARSEFLIRLSDIERRAVLDGLGLPAERLETPASWRKPLVPDPEPVGAANEGQAVARPDPNPLVPNPLVPLKGKKRGNQWAGAERPPALAPAFSSPGTSGEPVGTSGNQRSKAQPDDVGVF